MISNLFHRPKKKEPDGMSVPEVAPETDDGTVFSGNPLVRSLVTASFLIDVASLSGMYFFVVRGAGNVVVLHFNVYFGVDIVGSPWQALLIPGMSLLFLILNIPLAYRFYAVRERVAAHILLFASFFAALSTAVVTAAISFINS
jgi:hypothetical protein